MWADGGFFRISLFLMRGRPARWRFLVSAAFVACFSYPAPSWVQFLAMFLCIEVPARLLFKVPIGYSRCAWVFAPPLVSPVCLPLPGMLPAESLACDGCKRLTLLHHTRGAAAPRSSCPA